MKRWRILCAVAGVAVFGWLIPAPVKADSGLTVRGYRIDDPNPVRDDSVYPACAVYQASQINDYWGGGDIAGCGSDMVMLHYQGVLVIPAHQTIRFMVASDDGGWVRVGDSEFGDWSLKPCSIAVSDYVTLPKGVYPFDDWFFEWGGDTCNAVYWSVDEQPWEVIPASAFGSVVEETTTTTVPETTTTVPETTTTVLETTTVPAIVVTTIPMRTTTTVPETTTTTTVVSTTTVPSIDTLAQAVDPTVLESITGEEANQLFSAIDESQLTDQQGAAIVAAVQHAPVAVRKAFEKNINVFGGHTDGYKPLGSRINVRQRRIVIISGLTMLSAAIVPVRRRK